MMAGSHQYFYEDEVYRMGKKGQLELGIVLANAEFASDSDEDDDEFSQDSFNGPPLKKGFIRVAWYPSGHKTTVPEKKVGLADRSLMPGDVVRRLIKGKDTQRGYCRNVNVATAVQVVGTKQVIPSIDSRQLKPVETFKMGVAVVYGPWVGNILDVRSLVTFVLSDGSKCTLRDDDDSQLWDFYDRKKDSEYHRSDLHPGQVFIATAADLQTAKWIQGGLKDSKTRQNKSYKLTVEMIEVEQVQVHWQCFANSPSASNSDAMLQQPPGIVSGEEMKKLQMLNVFDSCTVQIGDRGFYVFQETDQVVSLDVWRESQGCILDVKKYPFRKGLKDGTKHKTDCENIENSKSSEGWETDDGDSASLTSSCSSISSIGGGGGGGGLGNVGPGKKKKTPGLMTKMLKFKKLRRSRRRLPFVAIRPNSELVVETLMTTSSADVVWQDGSVEKDISSTELYPIHHLDDQEFFPGDFVMENKESSCIRVYGVVQSVDHVGRTANVSWFHTYTSQQETEPKKLETVEVSVYDLKDHPDFQYRPGTVAIRVSNFENDEEKCTVGQVLDNYPEGRVHMWWVDGRTSMCWPQDLYKVGDYDSDDGELWADDGGASDCSWETESEVEDEGAAVGMEKSPSKSCVSAERSRTLTTNIEKAWQAMARLEKLFEGNPGLQTGEMMRKLLEVYKDCRYLDKLMGTSYFHEKHFQGLLERVREKRPSLTQRISDQVHRLSSPLCAAAQCTSDINHRVNLTLQMLNERLEQTLNKTSDSASTDAVVNSENAHVTSSSNSVSPNSVNGVQSSSQDDSGVFEHSVEASNNDNCDCLRDVETKKVPFVFGTRVMEKRVNSLKAKQQHHAQIDAQLDDNTNYNHVCAKLCALMKTQLLQAYSEVASRFQNDKPPLTWPEAPPPPPPPEETENSPTPEDPLPVILAANEGGFEMVSTVPASHKFKICSQPQDMTSFVKAVRKELALLQNALPAGCWVKGYEERMDLFSVMIRGPEKTPFEDGLFLFDVQLPKDYPREPPIFHYHSYCTDRLNPNLYEDGKVCVSLLGTWTGKGSELWSPTTSTLLQVIVSIQGLILNKEPYFNEAGYEKQRGSQQGYENSRMYNEMAILKVVQSVTKLAILGNQEFRNEIKDHFASRGPKLIERLEKLLDISESYNKTAPSPEDSADAVLERSKHWQQCQINQLSAADQPDFPLLPASRGFCISLRKALTAFRSVVSNS